ncbi:MAG: ATP-binding domain-containing protein [Acidimicrobiales bacterium]
MTDASSDRLIDPVDLPGEAMPGGGDGSGGGLDRDRVDRTVRAPDNNEPLLDAEGLPFQELDAERSDDLAQRSATVRQLAVDEQVWRFGHVIIDEAQDLTPMQWRMVVRRSTRGSVTMLGDLAQRSVGEPGTWDDHLPPEFSLFEQQNLTTNYRSPAEINDLAAAVLAELAPGLPASRAVRQSGHEPQVVEVASIAAELPGLLANQVGSNGSAGAEARGEESSAEGETRPPVVIGFDLPDGLPVRTLSPWRAKGLEFDSVVVVEPARFLDEPNGLSLLYVALTRSTDLLTIVHQRPLPAVLLR